MIDEAQVRAALQGRSATAFEAALSAAFAMGADGDRLLAGLDPLSGWRAVSVAAVLGDMEGPHGGRFLRNAVAATGPGTADLRCAATLALAKREREGATEVLAPLVNDRNAAVRDYALLGLAAYGDARAWDSVLKRLKALTSRPPSSSPDLSPVGNAVLYLLRHLDSDLGRTEAVRSILLKGRDRDTRSNWKWLHHYWPTIDDPEGWMVVDPAPAHARLLREPIIAAPAL